MAPVTTCLLPFPRSPAYSLPTVYVSHKWILYLSHCLRVRFWGPRPRTLQSAMFTPCQPLCWSSSVQSISHSLCILSCHSSAFALAGCVFSPGCWDSAPLGFPHTLLLVLSNAFAGCPSLSWPRYPLPGRSSRLHKGRDTHFKKSGVNSPLLLGQGGGDTFVKSLISAGYFYTS